MAPIVALLQTVVGVLLTAVFFVVPVRPAQAANNYAVGECRTAKSTFGAAIRPTSDAGSYLVTYHGDDRRYKQKLSNSEFFANAIVTLLEAPKHGLVVLVSDPAAASQKWYDASPPSKNWYHYWPKGNGFFGDDHFVMQVEKDGVKVRIHYVIKLLDEYEAEKGLCSPDQWKISSSVPALDNASLQCRVVTPS